MALWVLLGPLHGHADADQGSSHSQNLLCHPDNDSGSTEASGPLHAFSVCYLSLWLFVFIYLFMSTIFTSLINRCLGMFILGFSLYGILCTSWTWVIFFLSHVREVFNYNLFKYFLWLFLFSPSESLIMWILVYLMLSQRSLTLSSFLFFLFSLLCSWQWFQPFCLSAHLFILLPQLFCYWFLLVYFSFQDYIVHLFFVL